MRRRRVISKGPLPPTIPEEVSPATDGSDKFATKNVSILAKLFFKPSGADLPPLDITNVPAYIFADILSHGNLFNTTTAAAANSLVPAMPATAHSLLRMILRYEKLTFLRSGFLLFLNVLFTLAVPMCLHALLKHLSGHVRDDSQQSGFYFAIPSIMNVLLQEPYYGYSLAVFLFLSCVLQNLTVLHHWYEGCFICIRSEAILSSAVVAKSLSLSAAARASFSQSKLKGLLTSDARHLCANRFFPAAHERTWSRTITILVAGYWVISLLGIAGIVGCAVLICLIPCTNYMNSQSRKYAESIRITRDARVKAIGETFNGIQTIKVYGWTRYFEDLIGKAREEELVPLKLKAAATLLSEFVGSIAPMIVMVVTFTSFVILQEQKEEDSNVEGETLTHDTKKDTRRYLTAAVAFSSMYWFKKLQSPIKDLPTTMNLFTEANIALARLAELFNAQDTDVSGIAQWSCPPSTNAAATCTTTISNTNILDGTKEKVATSIPSMAPQQWLDLSFLRHVAADTTSSCSTSSSKDLTSYFSSSTEHISSSSLSSVSASVDGAAKAVTSRSSRNFPPMIRVENASFGLRLPLPEETKPKWSKTPAAATPQKIPQLKTILQDISFNCRPGSLTIITGRTGSGKSTLLCSIFGETERLKGTCTVNTNSTVSTSLSSSSSSSSSSSAASIIAYVGQTPWILHRTVQENICFLKSFDEARFSKVVSACALDIDIATFKDGKDQLVDDKGTSLSGGQKMRISLARAIYSDADIYLLDNILADVDVHMKNHIWTNAVVTLLCNRGKTVLWATETIQFETGPHVNAVLVLGAGGGSGGGGGGDGGAASGGAASKALMTHGAASTLSAIETPSTIIAKGSIAEVRRLCPERFATSKAATMTTSSSSVNSGAQTEKKNKSAAVQPSSSSSSAVVGVASKSAAIAAITTNTKTSSIATDTKVEKATLIQQIQHFFSGKTSNGKLFTRFTQSLGPSFMSYVLLLTFVFAQFISMLSPWWLGIWSSTMAAAKRHHTSMNTDGGIASAAATSSSSSSSPSSSLSALVSQHTSDFSPMTFAGIYLLVNIITASAMAVRSAALNSSLLRVSTTLHNDAVHGLLAAPMSFFAKNAEGKIATRLVSDVAEVESGLSSSIRYFGREIFSVIGTIFVLGSTVPLSLIAVIALSYTYIVVAQRYRVVARDLAKLQSESKGPILSHFIEAHRGGAVIRAFGPKAMNIVIAKHCELFSAHMRAYITFLAAKQNISATLDCIGSVLVGVCAAAAVWASASGTLTAGQAGFALEYAMACPTALMWTIRSFTELEAHSLPIGRLAEYADLESEDQEESRLRPPRPTTMDEHNNDFPEDREEEGGGENKTLDTKIAKQAHSSVKRRNPSTSIITTPPILDMRGVHTRYKAGDEWNLHQLNLQVHKGMKVAVVGRTGAGKTSVFSSILRLYPYERGDIFVQGVNLNEISRAEGRALVTCALQDRFLFSGTLRQNLLGPSSPSPFPSPSSDISATISGTATPNPPKLTFTDTETETQESLTSLVWDVLDSFGLKQKVSSLAGGLDATISEGNYTNFSAGEKDLLCMSRAIIRYCRQQQKLISMKDDTFSSSSSKIVGGKFLRSASRSKRSKSRGVSSSGSSSRGGLILCDEPTAQTDSEANTKVHDVLLRALPDAAVICICHRLDVTSQFDIVVVMEKGRIIEIGPPAELLMRKDDDDDDVDDVDSGSSKNYTSTTGKRKVIQNKDTQQNDRISPSAYYKGLMKTWNEAGKQNKT